MKNLPRYLIVLFLIFTLPVSSEINDKDELREFLTDNGIKYIAEDGYDRIFSFNEKGEGTYYMGSNKKEMPLIWEVVNKNTLKSGHPKIVEQKGWTIMKIDFEKKKLHMDLSSINGEKYTFDITFTNSNTSKTEKTKSADSSLTYLGENEKNFPWCMGWISEKARVEGQHKVTDMNRKLMQKPTAKKIIDILRSYMDATGGDWKKINNTFDSNLMYEYQNGRGAHIVFHRTYTGGTLEAKKSLAEMKCIVID